MLPDGLDFVLEAPCATWPETESLRKRCTVPIIMDELAELDGDIARIVAEDIADGIGLKISKAGGLTRGRRHRDICRAAGLTISVQDTAGSAIAFAGIVHLGATVPERNLGCILDCRDMVTLETAAFDAPAGRRRLGPESCRPWPDGQPRCPWRSRRQLELTLFKSADQRARTTNPTWRP